MSTTTPWIKTNIVVWGECVAGRGCKVQDRTNRSELKVTDLFNAGKTSVNKQLTNQGGSCRQHIHRGDEAKWTHLGNTAEQNLTRQGKQYWTSYTQTGDFQNKTGNNIRWASDWDTWTRLGGCFSILKSVLVFLLFRTSQVHAGVRTSRDGRTQHMSVLECLWWHRNSVFLLLLTALTTNVINICYGNCR